jgi:two-component system response regulator ResD
MSIDNPHPQRGIVVSPAVLYVEPNLALTGDVIRAVRSAGWNVMITSDLRKAIAHLSTRYVRLLVVAGMSPAWTRGAVAALRPAAASSLLVVGPRDSDEMMTLLGQGADDVVEWRSANEFLLRSAALCRRQHGLKSTLARWLTAGELRLDRGSRTCEYRGKPLPLTHNEFDLLAELMARPRETVASDQLIHRVWRIQARDGMNTLRIHVGRLRGKLADAEGTDPTQWIESVRGIGYRFSVPVRSEVLEESNDLRDLIGMGARAQSIYQLVARVSQAGTVSASAQAIAEWAVDEGICDVACAFRTDLAESGLLVSERLSLAGQAPLWQRGDHLVGEGFMGGHVYETGEALFLPDLRGQMDRFPVSARLFEYAEFRSCVILPIRIDGRVWGDMTFINHAENSLTAASVDFLGAVAGVASLAMGSALAYREYDADWMNTTELRPLVA